jgi:hypothetical protein
MKSASFSWFMKACLQASIVEDKKSLSLGGAARCRMSLMGVAIDVEGGVSDLRELLVV